MHARIAKMKEELRELRDHNACLVEKNQELEGEILSKGIEHGKDLLFEQTNTKTLAAELEEISNKKNDEFEDTEISKLQNCLIEQEHVNLQLQTYIDTVLLNIMERNPELLEIPKK